MFLQTKLHLPDLLRQREHSGSSRDSGYSSYFGTAPATSTVKLTSTASDMPPHAASALPKPDTSMAKLQGGVTGLQRNDAFPNTAQSVFAMNGATGEGIDAFRNNRAVFMDASQCEEVSSLRNNRNIFLDKLNGEENNATSMSNFNPAGVVNSAFVSNPWSAGNDLRATAEPFEIPAYQNSFGITNSSIPNPVLEKKPNGATDHLFIPQETQLLHQSLLNSNAGKALMLNAASNGWSPADVPGLAYSQMTDIANMRSSMRTPFMGSTLSDMDGRHSVMSGAGENNFLPPSDLPMRNGIPDLNTEATPGVDKLCQLLPTDPTAQKNFLDNIQLLNQLSTIAPPPVEEVDFSLSNFNQANKNNMNPQPMGFTNNNRGYNNTDFGTGRGNGNISSSDDFFLTLAKERVAGCSANGFSSEKGNEVALQELATVLLNHCKMSTIDISLAEVQLMLRRASFQDPYAKHWLSRNFCFQKYNTKLESSAYAGNSMETVGGSSFFPQPGTAGDKSYANGSMIGGMGAKFGGASGPGWAESLGPQRSHTPALKHDVANRSSLPPPPPPSAGPHHQRPHHHQLVNHNTDNYKITSFGNGSYMTSKNCANFEKLTMHSSPKDFPGHLLGPHFSQAPNRYKYTSMA